MLYIAWSRVRSLMSLVLTPIVPIDFSLADGSKITRRVTSGYFELNGEGGPAPVVYGEEGDKPPVRGDYAGGYRPGT